MVRVTTRFLWRNRYSSSFSSRGNRSSGRPARVTLRDSKSISRSPQASMVSTGRALPRRIRLSSRADSSANPNGLVR